MSDGILVRVLGDFGPFSTMGKSIGYQVSIGDTSFLVDCGSPLFQQIGGHGLKTIRGLIVTHCHDDHKRWFTDLALFNRYAPDVPHKVPLITSEAVGEGLLVASGPALDTSLDDGSAKVIDLAWDDYVDFCLLGPRAKYRIISSGSGGTSSLSVVDCKGDIVGPDRAKIVISARNGKPRLLFKDPEYGEWVEPQSFYPFSSTLFYEQDQHRYHDPAGFTIEAINAPVWHGVPSIGLRFSTANETLVFSGDTVHDVQLWQALHTDKRSQRLAGSRSEFEEASIIRGDINHYIERTWSAERYREARRTFEDAVVIHDIATRKSIVHTDYRRLEHTVLKRENVILTHCPDKMTSAWALCRAEKNFLIRGRCFYEVVGERLWPMNADIYHKEDGKYYVGYRDAAGNNMVYEHDGILNLGGTWDAEGGTPLFSIDLYEDIGGKYFPKLECASSRYVPRPDGQVELVTYTQAGSHGEIVQDQRERLSGRENSGGGKPNAAWDDESTPAGGDAVAAQ